MKYIIVDLEATCWEQKGKPNEIIEIGAVKINQNAKEESRFSTFVKPVLYPLLSDFCINLTTIKQKDVDSAPTFNNAIKQFMGWIEEDSYVLCSWGFYDKNQFTKDCELHRMPVGWLKNHISLKHQHAYINPLSRPVGMETALKMDKLQLTGTHHRGIDDAVNISKIFIKHFYKWKFPI